MTHLTRPQLLNILETDHPMVQVEAAKNERYVDFVIDDGLNKKYGFFDLKRTQDEIFSQLRQIDGSFKV